MLFGLCGDGSTYRAQNYDTGTSAYKYPRSDLWKFLDGSNIMAVYDEAGNNKTVNSMADLSAGLRGQTKNSTETTTYMASQSITYNGVGGCRRRIGFAIKMPPTDYTQSSTTGISQVKLQLQIYAQ